MYKPTEILVERGEENAPVVIRATGMLPDVPVRIVDRNWERTDTGPKQVTDFGNGKRRLLFMRQRTSFLDHCPAGGAGVVCCNYLVASLISNCPMDCSYCFLQEYLANNPLLKVFTNVGDLLTELAKVVDRQPWRQYRIGTGELSDSLALDDLLGFSKDLVPFFARRKNALLEFKTKSQCVDNLLGLDSGGRVVVSWTLTPPVIADSEEHGTASFHQRVEAARLVGNAGYKVGFHFDPLIEYRGWEKDYNECIRELFSRVDASNVAWVSLGSLRLTNRLRKIMRQRFPTTKLLSGEQIPCDDGKWRVFQPMRVSMYRFVIEALRNVAPTVPFYMCMETPAVWRNVQGRAPACEKEIARGLTVPNLPQATQ